MAKSRSFNPIDAQPVLTVAEVAKLMGFSTPTVISLFEKEPGVIVKESPKIDTRQTRKRRYRAFRIPQHVYERVLRRLSVG